MGAPEFWNDSDKAKSISSKAAGLKKKLESFLKLESRVADIDEGVALAKEYDDAELAREALVNAAGLEGDIRSYELLTLLDQPSDIDRAVDAKTDDFLTKPINKTELLIRVKAALKSREHKNQLDRALAYMDGVQGNIATGS